MPDRRAELRRRAAARSRERAGATRTGEPRTPRTPLRCDRCELDLIGHESDVDRAACPRCNGVTRRHG